MKSGEGEAEKEENLGEKLRRGVLVGKSKGPSTPVALPSWRLSVLGPSHHNRRPIQDHHHHQTSARKLAAALWEFHHYYYFPPFQVQMHRPLNNGASADPRLRRRHYTLHKDKAPDISKFLAETDASPSSPDQVHPSFSLPLKFVFFKSDLVDWLIGFIWVWVFPIHSL